MFIHRLDDEIDLRIFDLSHSAELYRMTERNLQRLAEYMPWAEDTHTLADTQAFIRDGLRQYANNDGFQAGIWYHGRLVGCIGYHGIDWTNYKTEIGYWLDGNATGKGIMTRACRGIVRYSFRHYRLHRIQIRCMPENTRSRAVAERLGFRQEGILRDEVYMRDRWHDHVVYSLLSHEWIDL